MIFFESLMVAFSTYSIIPMPNFEWNEKNMKYAICFLPMVGFFCGAFIWGWTKIAEFLNLSDFLVAAVLTCIPILLSGGIHMDGFMDTVDALSSHQSHEKKLEILSDPRCGAFAVIFCWIYLILNMAFLYEIYTVGNLLIICPVFVLSRCISSICAVNLPKARKSGMLSSYTQNAERKIVNTAMIIISLISIFVMLLLSSRIAIFAILSGFFWTVLYCRMVKKNFGGVTGDTAGFFLQIFELSCIIGVWLGGVL